jgi:molecular chaperone DnaK
VYPPLVQALWSLTDKEPLTAIPPSNLFVVGLARGGAALERTESARRPDCLSTGIGIELPGGRFLPLIRAGEQLPIRLKRKHATTRDNQTEIELNLYQGDAELVRSCTQLGVIMLSGVPKGPRGTVFVDLSIEVDMDEVATFTLSEESSGNRARLVIATKETPEQRRATVAAQTSAEAASSEPAPKPPPKRGLLSRLLGRS